jgi:hypothetical protein
MDTMTKYGRRFSVVSVPYSLKLLIQELAAINIQLRVVTEDNLPQIDSMAFSDNLNKLTLNPNMTPEKLVKEMERAIANGEKPVATPKSLTSTESREMEAEKSRTARELENRQNRTSPQYPTDVSPAYVPPEITNEYDDDDSYGNSPAYVPGYPQSPAFRPESPQFIPQSPEFGPETPPRRYSPQSPEFGPPMNTGGGVPSINDFELGEPVYFTRSTELGLDAKHVWIVAKKGGTLLTLTTDRQSGDNSILSNLTNSDLVQIAKADELVKQNAYSQWEEQRAGARERQFMLQPPNVQSQPFFQPQAMPPINIKFVGGNDFSKEGGESGGGGGETVNVGGGGGGGDFNNLVIPTKMNGGGELKQTLDTPKSDGSQKSIMKGLSEFGSLVINKIM